MMNRLVPKLPRSTAMLSILLIGAGWLYGCNGGGSGKGGAVSTANQAPTASITSPVGSFFNEGENIAFSGSGSDIEDGQLDSSALEWRSSVDGVIGTGSTLVTSALSADDHEITLSATDSDGRTYTTSPRMIHIEPTRFIKMGTLTTGVTDASNAFDGDSDTAATIKTDPTEFIHFRAYIGDEERFFFKLKLGGTAIPGTRVEIEGLVGNSAWAYIVNFYLYNEKTVTIEVADAQRYADTEGYINLRARGINGQESDNVIVYDIWRDDPLYNEPSTRGVVNPDRAFDRIPSSFATVNEPWNLLNPQGSQNFLHFQAYIGSGTADTFAFNILTDALGSQDFLSIEIEDLSTPTPDDWKPIESLNLNSTAVRTITFSDVQDSIDASGYISLRVSWVTVNLNPPGSSLNIYDIWRNDPFWVGPKSITDRMLEPQRAVDSDPDTYGIIYYFWSELGNFDYLHLQAFAGDAPNFTFHVKTAPSSPGSQSEMFVEGEEEPDQWSLIERIPLDNMRTTPVILQNARRYVDADGYISIRIRWLSDSLVHDALIYEIWRDVE